MTTLYIDVFVLINFTVDILALFIAAKALHIRTNVPRLIICGMLGAIIAVLDLFIDHSILKALNVFSFLFCVGLFTGRNITCFRRIKLVVLFFACEIFIGGIVNYAYTVLDKYFSRYFSNVEGGTENYEALIFSLIILLVIGVFKLLILIFAGEGSVKSLEVKIEVEGCVGIAEALVDSGNLVLDPMNSNPVIFIKPNFAQKILPKNIIELSELDKLNCNFRRRIRLVPVTRNGSTHVLTGIRVDKASVMLGGREEEILATIAIDKEEGSFGGYEVLVPASAIEHVV